MAFASSLLPVPPYRVCATPASEVAAFSPAKKSVSLAAARQRRGSRHGVRAEVNESGSVLAVDALSQVKHVLLPVLDRNPYLSEGTRQLLTINQRSLSQSMILKCQALDGISQKADFRSLD
uniref:Uncharacterized protein n=1 Tax=Zea mays TaxID=4577 RepID=A0A804QKF5_MAIZE